MVNNTLLQIIVCLSHHEFIYLHVIQYITPWTPAQDQFNQEKKKTVLNDWEFEWLQVGELLNKSLIWYLI